MPWAALPPAAQALVTGLLAVDPTRRWTPARALACPWTLQEDPDTPSVVPEPALAAEGGAGVSTRFRL